MNEAMERLFETKYPLKQERVIATTVLTEEILYNYRQDTILGRSGTDFYVAKIHLLSLTFNSLSEIVQGKEKLVEPFL